MGSLPETSDYPAVSDEPQGDRRQGSARRTGYARQTGTSVYHRIEVDILTGTPHGVGMAAKPPRWPRPGDVVTIENERIGSLTNPVEREPLRDDLVTPVARQSREPPDADRPLRTGQTVSAALRKRCRAPHCAAFGRVPTFV